VWADGQAVTSAESLAPAARLLSDEALLAVLAGLPDPILVVDAGCSLLWGNRAAEVFFGRSSDSSLGMSGLDLVHPDDLEFALLSLLSVQAKDIGRPIEVRLRSDSGWRLVELIGAPLQGSSEGALVLSMRDLTERRVFEVANDDVAKFRSLVHNAATLMMLVSPDGIVGAASGALARVLGRDPGVVVGRPVADLVQLSDREALHAALDAAVLSEHGTGRAATVEVGLLHVSGGPPVSFELTIVNLLEDPTVRGFVVSGHDITARKFIEIELLSTLSLLNATLDATDDGILVVDMAGAITSVNRKFAELWRLPAELLATKDDGAAIEFVLEQLANPEVFVAKIAELYAQPEADSHDILEFLDGRVVDRYSRPQFVDGKIVGRVWSFRDITDRKRLEEQLSHQALHDSLTGLANQSLFRDRVEHALARLAHRGGNLAVLFLDLDNFKTVNDSLGHSAGDLLLIGATERLVQCLRATDTAARLGGDEFAVLLEDAGSDRDVIEVAERLQAAFRRTFTVDGTEVSAGVSIGIAFATSRTSCDQLLRNADLAMYTAKRRGKGRFETYEDEMHARALERLQVEAELRHAIKRGELVLDYQPIVELATGRVVSVEALVRWRHPVRGVLGPDVFIALAEETGLIEDLGQLVLTQACADLHAWQKAGIAGSAFSVSVNLAPKQLVGQALLGEVEAALVAHHLDPSCLIFEITEGAMMLDTSAAIANLTALRALGVRTAVDDFGTGYSSLAYLQRFPIDILKIDKSFVDCIDAGPEASALPHAIIRLAQTLHLTPVAEGVERESQCVRLRELGCELAQGYFFSVPVSADAIVTMLRTR
jgi:diguanylate cyclase (GGDEF)-like protein/PAS domain S-box-containing protein